MRRRLFSLLAALSLLLSTATAFLWFRSYRVQDEPTFARRNGLFVQLTSRRGKLVIDVVRKWPEDSLVFYRGSPSESFGPFYVASTGMNDRREQLGVAVSTGHYSIATTDGRVLIENSRREFDSICRAATDWPISRGFEIAAPHGYYDSVLSAPWLIWLFIRVRRGVFARRCKRNSLCTQCGYDLRASPNRCPECGAESAAVRI